ncbi:MAG: hypothetical protein ACI867_000734 [Glaciecola sp.]|jgi:hypothetical protein
MGSRPDHHRSEHPGGLGRRLVAGAFAVALAAGLTIATPTASSAQTSTAGPDRYDLAKGCWAIASPLTGFVTRAESVFSATGTEIDTAEPFHLEPTELGVYLLFGTAEDFLAQSGATTRIAAAPAPEAEWTIDAHLDGGFTLHEFATGRGLGVDEAGALVQTDAGNVGADRQFTFTATTGCALWPEVDINISGEHPTGDTTTEDVQGYLDAHLHHMAFEFLGGSAHCGRPWHRYGVTFALVDCPDHAGDGVGAVLENFLRTGQPTGSHDTVGWPTFVDWPAPDSLTHEQTYYKWMERSWRGGQRLYVNLFVENSVLCEIYPIKRNSCDEMDSVRRQIKDIRDLENYIDAQSGGPGEGWFRIVTDPFQAREVMQDGKMAVVLGIEISSLFDCRLLQGIPQCTTDEIDEQLAEMYDAGVRQMELLNKFDTAMSGVAGDGGALGVLINGAQFRESTRFWDMRTCEIPEGVASEDFHDHDKNQEAPPGQLPEQDTIFGAINDLYGPGAVAPVYTATPHCNAAGLGERGAYTIERMAERGMIIDPDHMSVLGRREALDLIESLGYEGVVSSHGWSTDEAYERILEMGGFIGARSGGSTDGFISDWQDTLGWSDDRYTYGLGFGADANGFGAQPGPVAQYLDGKAVTYPYTGFGGVTIDKNVSGERVYDVNVDGVAHYGLYPDWFEALRIQAGDGILEDMQRAPEAYLQMWERAVGIKGDACRADIADLDADQIAAVALGTSWIDVLKAIGQPTVRFDEFYTYCLADGSSARLRFDGDDRLIEIGAAAGPAPVLGGAVVPAPGPLPATGGGAALAALATLALAGGATARRRRP